MERVRRVQCVDQRGTPTHIAVGVHQGRMCLYVDGAAVALDETQVYELLTWAGEGYYRLLHGHYSPE